MNEVHAIGYSSGAYGALLFGHLCRMQSVWAFSPRTARPKSSGETKARLRELLSVHNGVTQYHLWHSAGNKRDGAFADMLAGCPGVTVHPFTESGDEHSLLRYLAERGLLRSILPPFVPSEGRLARGVAET